MATKQQVYDLADGTRTARDIAEILGCHPTYVHNTAKMIEAPLAKSKVLGTKWSEEIRALKAENARLKAALGRQGGDR